LPARGNPVLEPALNRAQCILCWLRSPVHPAAGERPDRVSAKRPRWCAGLFPGRRSSRVRL